MELRCQKRAQRNISATVRQLQKRGWNGKLRGLPTWMQKLLTRCHTAGMDRMNSLSRYGDSMALQSHFLA